MGLGTARGGMPSSRIAVYKGCWTDTCNDTDILSAFDDAIADGVDIISISVGGGNQTYSYFNDSIAIGAFHAMTKGILTSNSAGNSGPGLRTINNFSPWTLTVAASTIDRKFYTNVQLGNKQIFGGISINTRGLKGKMYPLIHQGYCSENSVDARRVRGKILLCDKFVRPNKTSFLANITKGVIMLGADPQDSARSFPLPASHLGVQDGRRVRLYFDRNRNSYPSASATIFPSHKSNDTNAPYVASFSSRGPNPETLDVLKPDISAPGVEILAAWSPRNSVSQAPGDNRFPLFNIISGTSMSCPYATAIASYVKSFNPTWSPAALKSALMTTAKPMRPDLNPDAEFAYGSGHVDPIKARYPGLIYDAGEADYVRFLCGQGYNAKSLQLITNDNTTCSPTDIRTAVWDLNYPSFALSTFTASLSTHVFRRTVTNVGSPNSRYKSNVTAPLGLKITVKPPALSFSYVGEKLPFTVSIKGIIRRDRVSASLVWNDGVYKVRSPIFVFFKSSS